MQAAEYHDELRRVLESTTMVAAARLTTLAEAAGRARRVSRSPFSSSRTTKAHSPSG
ncbi:hypothetical protein RHCRD62_30583 [Rhodococcus sp. RD6.2]|nr:hypothetical protein RHCRD62_30583 [Rhodococcus sp. RD6.2]